MSFKMVIEINRCIDCPNFEWNSMSYDAYCKEFGKLITNRMICKEEIPDFCNMNNINNVIFVN